MYKKELTRRKVRLHPSYTRTHTNAIPLDSWSISRDSTIPLVSRSQGCTYNPTGLPVYSQGCTHKHTSNQDARLNLSPPSWIVLILYILQETVRLSVCARQVRGSILRNLCCLMAHLCRVVSLRQYSVEPAWPSLAQDLHVSGT